MNAPFALERVESALRAAGSRSTQRGSWTCPAHEDGTASLAITESPDGKVLLHCHAGCKTEDVMAKLGLAMRDLFPPRERKRSRRGEESHGAPGKSRSTPQHPGVTVATYAAAKALPEDLLRQLGLLDVPYFGVPAIQIPYRTETGAEGPVRYRLRLEKGPEGDDRFRWRKGSTLIPYGLWRLERARAAGFTILVEGESDAQTLWHHELPALGIPGADTWRDDWAEFVEGFTTIYLIEEPDQGGKTLRARLTASPLRDRLRIVALGEFKDPSALHLANPEEFKARFASALEDAVPATEALDAERDQQAAVAWKRCIALAREPRILDCFVERLENLGVVGEERAAKLIFLAVVSRLLPRPVSVVVKGPSSAGKSHTTETTLRFFPASATYTLSGMSERFLVYDPEPLAHRMIVITEAAALVGEFATFAAYLVRTLLSEGRLIYGTVEKGEDGTVQGRRIEKPGPTGVILTTTEIRLHQENETRLLSIPVNDTQEQTRRVLFSLANGHDRDEELADWHALSDWIEAGDRRVEIPYAEALAELIPPVAVRLRRDFGALLNLIRAHALLHRATREGGGGGIVASIDDYLVVRDLVVDLMGEAAEATVPETVRETVEAVGELIAEAPADAKHASVTAIAKVLKLDKASASRRYQAARRAGHLANAEADGRGRTKRGVPARIVLGEPLPEQVDLLPTAEQVLRCCARFRGETEGPLPPSDEADQGGGGGLYPPENHCNTATPANQEDAGDALGDLFGAAS